jgi:hypothetical protein
MSALKWISTASEASPAIRLLRETATVSSAEPNETVAYRINKFDNGFAVILLLTQPSGGTMNYLIAEAVATETLAKAKAQADWDAGAKH